MKRLQMKFQDNTGNKKMMSFTNIKENLDSAEVERVAGEIIAAKVFTAKEGVFDALLKAELIETTKTELVNKEN